MTVSYKDCFPSGVSKFRLTATHGKISKERSSYISKTRELFNKMCVEGACQNRKKILEMENLSLDPLLM